MSRFEHGARYVHGRWLREEGIRVDDGWPDETARAAKVASSCDYDERITPPPTGHIALPGACAWAIATARNVTGKRYQRESARAHAG